MHPGRVEYTIVSFPKAFSFFNEVVCFLKLPPPPNLYQELLSYKHGRLASWN